jgi:dTDP-4-amino-4,6-dideoxygalactose transaminase
MLWSLQRRLRGDHQLRTLQDAIADEVTTLPVQISSRQAAWGLDGLRTAGERVRHSCRLTMLYLEGLSGLQAIRLVSEAENFPLYYFPILTSRKKELLDAARRARHEVIAWPLTTTIYPIERTEELVQSDYLPGSCPLAEQTAGSLCGLPVDLPTDERRAGRLIEFLRRFDEAA